MLGGDGYGSVWWNTSVGKVIRNTLISAAAVVVFVGAGFAIGSTGFRWNQFAGEGFWGFTSHQWGILLSGIVGAMAGGAVAILVLWGTLRAQARWTKNQLEQSERHHKEQLEEQRAILALEREATAARDSEDRATSALVEWSEVLQGIKLNVIRTDDENSAIERSLVRPIGAFRRAPHGWEGLADVAIDVLNCYKAALTKNPTNALSVLQRSTIEFNFLWLGLTLTAFAPNDKASAKTAMRTVAAHLHTVADVLSAAGVPMVIRTPAPPKAP